VPELSVYYSYLVSFRDYLVMQAKALQATKSAAIMNHQCEHAFCEITGGCLYDSKLCVPVPVSFKGVTANLCFAYRTQNIMFECAKFHLEHYINQYLFLTTTLRASGSPGMNWSIMNSPVSSPVPTNANPLSLDMGPPLKPYRHFSSQTDNSSTTSATVHWRPVPPQPSDVPAWTLPSPDSLSPLSSPETALPCDITKPPPILSPTFMSQIRQMKVTLPPFSPSDLDGRDPFRPLTPTLFTRLRCLEAIQAQVATNNNFINLPPTSCLDLETPVSAFSPFSDVSSGHFLDDIFNTPSSTAATCATSSVSSSEPPPILSTPASPLPSSPHSPPPLSPQPLTPPHPSPSPPPRSPPSLSPEISDYWPDLGQIIDFDDSLSIDSDSFLDEPYSPFSNVLFEPSEIQKAHTSYATILNL